jgi:phage gpG-like protein
MAKRDGFNFDLLMEKMKSSKPKLLTTLEVQATDHFVGSWKKKGWVDRGLEQWREVKRRQPGTKAYKAAKKAARTRAILVQSGRLRRSFYTRIKRMDIVQIANSAPYAQVHNEGARGTAYVKPHSRYVKSGEYAGTGIFSTKTRREKKVQLEAKQNVRGYSRRVNIPQRQFMGHSHQLEQQQIRAIQRWINEAIRN